MSLILKNMVIVYVKNLKDIYIKTIWIKVNKIVFTANIKNI